MSAPRLKRTNTIGIRYLEGSSRYEDDYPLILDETLGINDNELEGISELGKNRLIVKLNSSERYDEICEVYCGIEIAVTEDIKIKVEDLSTYRSYVTVRNVPFEMSDYMLTDIFSKYGNVNYVKRNTRNQGRYRGIFNGERTVSMDITRPIPSFLFIECARVYIYIYYKGQTKTCKLCGQDTHFASECNVRASQRTNIINENDFPILSRRREQNDGGRASQHQDVEDNDPQPSVIIDRPAETSVEENRQQEQSSSDVHLLPTVGEEQDDSNSMPQVSSADLDCLGEEPSHLQSTGPLENIMQHPQPADQEVSVEQHMTSVESNGNNLHTEEDTTCSQLQPLTENDFIQLEDNDVPEAEGTVADKRSTTDRRRTADTEPAEGTTENMGMSDNMKLTEVMERDNFPSTVYHESSDNVNETENCSGYDIPITPGQQWVGDHSLTDESDNSELIDDSGKLSAKQKKGKKRSKKSKKKIFLI